jgi:hypothetical protein
MPHPITPDSAQGTLTPLSLEACAEYLLKHADEFRKDTEKVFKYVGENYNAFKPHIDSQVTAMVCDWVADGLGASYEDVSTFLDEETIKKFLGEEWYKF